MSGEVFYARSRHRHTDVKSRAVTPSCMNRMTAPRCSQAMRCGYALLFRGLASATQKVHPIEFRRDIFLYRAGIKKPLRLLLCVSSRTNSVENKSRAITKKGRNDRPKRCQAIP